VTARVIASAVVVATAIVAGLVASAVASRRASDEYARFHYRRLVRFGATLVAVVALLVVWRRYVGHIGIFAGLFLAGLAFAMQEVIGALAGWFNIVSGRIYRVGDRIQLSDVQGDVIDITPLRTKILEIGSQPVGLDTASGSWVQGRQLTGRIVSISNKATFEAPVYNFSATFDYVWEELTVPIPHDADWERAEEVMLEVARRVSATEGAERAIDAMTRHYPLPRAEVEPRVFMRLTDNYVELAARFVVPVREARVTKDRMARHIHTRLAEAGIPIASTTVDVTVRGEIPQRLQSANSSSAGGD
jgi:small-conductance mechanosensitive channel